MGFLLLSGATTGGAQGVSAEYPVTLTAYNAVPEQTDSDPFVTAAGTYSNPEVVAARSHDLADELPFGTIIELDGPTSKQNTCGYGIVAPVIGYRVIADTMNMRYTNRVDVLLGNSRYTMADGTVKNAANVLGICDGITVRVVGYVDLTHPNRLPKTQAQLAALVHTGSGLAVK
jgi:3D (Asp-Asp-Asp) domain-containing protein